MPIPRGVRGRLQRPETWMIIKIIFWRSDVTLRACDRNAQSVSPKKENRVPILFLARRFADKCLRGENLPRVPTSCSKGTVTYKCILSVHTLNQNVSSTRKTENNTRVSRSEENKQINLFLYLNFNKIWIYIYIYMYCCVCAHMRVHH